MLNIGQNLGGRGEKTEKETNDLAYDTGHT
jgi:hypothetical protein